jgi:origin recognition complex subunit 3
LADLLTLLQYAYMCHFYANPLSVLLAPDLQDVIPLLQEEHLDAIRNLPSFKPAMELLVEQGNVKQAGELITSNSYLKHGVTSALHDGKHLLLQQMLRIRALVSLASMTANTIDPVQIYIQAFSGKLNDSDIIQNILDTVKRSSPQELVKMMDAVIEHVQLEDRDETSQLFCQSLNQCRANATTLRIESEEAGQSLQSRYTIQRKTMRTTVVAQKVQLSKQESSLSKQDAAFTEVVDETVSLFEEYFTFQNIKDTFLHESWLYDSKSPYTSVFTPRPRHAVERALSAPHDYLGCACCKGTTGGLSSSQPPTAILYQLYLETGGLINVFDLWSAFYTIVGGKNGEECDERSALALFYRALADLKLLGMVKQSRKKTDHLAKLAWKGL